MMKRILFLSFPFYLNDELKNAVLALLTGVFVVVFLFIYTPFSAFNEGQTTQQVWISGIITFGVLLLNLLLFPKLFPVLFELSNWNVLKYIIFNVWLFFSIGLANTYINLQFFCAAKPVFEVVFYTNMQVVFIGIFPLFFVTFLVRNQMLAENLRNALEINKKIALIKSQLNSAEKESEIIIQTETSESLSLRLNDFFFAEAQDNYSLLFYKEKNTPTKKLLRLTLKNLESQFNNQFIIRCHRSYLVNVKAILKISGNANGYKLAVQDNQVEIPVSRSRGKEIIRQIQEIKDLLDIL